MSFLKSIFGPRIPDKMEYVKAMVEMADEGERTHRGMIYKYNSCVDMKVLPKPAEFPASAKPKALYMIRLFSSLYMVLAYSRSGRPSDAGMEFLNAATGIALEPLHSRGEFSREEATKLIPYLKSTYAAVIAAMDAGPIEFGALKKEHYDLANKMHEVLAESIGCSNYTEEVAQQFNIAVIGNVSAALNHARKWIF